MVKITDSIIDNVHKLLSYIPHILIVTSVIALLFILFIGRYDYLGFGGMIFGACIFTSLLLIYGNTKKLSNHLISDNFFSFSQNILIKLYIIAACALFVWNLIGNPDLIQLILLGILYFIIILQIFSKKCGINIIIIEMIVTTLLLIVPQLFTPAFYYGCGDILVHTQWTYLISETGHIGSFLGDYSNFFTYHIFSSMSSQITNIAENDAIYLVSIGASVISLIFIYYVARCLTKSPRASIIAVFFYITLHPLLKNMLQPAPRLMATVAFFILLYILLKKWDKMFSPLILGGIIALYLILTHHAQTPIFLLVIVLLCMGSLIYYRKVFIGNKSVLYFYIFTVISYFVYTYFAQIFGFYLIRVAVRVENADIISSEIAGILHEVTFIKILSYVPQVILIIFTLIGLYLMIKRLPNNTKYIVLLPLILIFFFFMPEGVADIIPITGQLNMYRWRMVFLPFFAIVMGMGVLAFINIVSATQDNLKKLGTIIVIVLCSILVITSPLLIYSYDNQLQYSSDQFTPNEYFFVDSDIALFTYIGTTIALDSTIYTDREHTKYSYLSKTPSIYLPYYKFSYAIESLFLNSDSSIHSQYLIYPEAKYNRAGIWVLTANNEYDEIKRILMKKSAEHTNNFTKNSYSYYQVYDNGDSINFVVV